MRTLFCLICVCVFGGAGFLTGCSSSSDPSPKKSNAKTREATPEEIATYRPELAEITEFHSPTLTFHLIDGGGRSAEVEIYKFFPEFQESLREVFQVSQGQPLGKKVSITTSKGRTVELDFSTDFQVIDIGTRDSIVNEQYLEELDKPVMETIYDETGRPIQQWTTHITKFRQVHRPQLYVTLYNNKTDERFRLLQPLYVRPQE